MKKLQRNKIKKIIDADKIAAGEVIERPANIIKELIENSIDADAKEIRIIIKKAGKSLIQVIDDGTGISRDEIVLAFERFTSSKIRRIEDLDHLSTLGFRGEALASIAAVSQIEIISRTHDESTGTQLFIEGGKVLNKKEISSPIGTNIKIKNLFFNLPARLKFLKSDSTELAHITDIIQRYSLAYPKLHFIYRHNDLDILNCPALNDLKTTIFHIYGKKIAKLMESFDYNESDSHFKLYGLLGHPQIAVKNRNKSSIFLNRRYIISDLLYEAVRKAYEGTLMISKYPFYIIYLEIDPSSIDFNVHPKKLEVRFENEDFVYSKVYKVLRSFVEDKFIVKEGTYLSTELDQFFPKKTTTPLIETETATESNKNSQVNNANVNLEESNKTDLESIDKTVQLSLKDHSEESAISEQNEFETYLREKYIIVKNFPKLKLISYTGQLSNKYYIVLEGMNENNQPGLYILDQHAASERINKEKLIEGYESTKLSRQLLISPLKIDVSPSEKFFLEGNLENIKKLGFEFEYFGGNTFILRAIPIIMGKIPDINIIRDIIADITEIGKDKSFIESKEEIINYLACHKSIRGGEILTLKEIRNLILELSKCKDPFHCAHGRPTLKFFSFSDLDKLFKRIV